jgi:hypothetical protein
VLPSPFAELLLELELFVLAALALELADFAIPLLAAGFTVFKIVGTV